MFHFYKVKIETKWSHSCHVPGNRVRKIKKHGPEKRMGQEKKRKRVNRNLLQGQFHRTTSTEQPVLSLRQFLT
jgi:hypothetical protein